MLNRSYHKPSIAVLAFDNMSGDQKQAYFSAGISEDKVRITAQLIDAIKGHHLWAERYDRDLTDIFDLQDEITKKIIIALQVNLTEGEQARMFGRQFTNFDTYLKFQEIKLELTKGHKDGFAMYGKLAQEIVDMEPESAEG